VTLFRTIVIGHDGTGAADAALRFAERLAADDARLLITRVAPAARRAAAEEELQRVRPAPRRAVETRVIGARTAVRGLVAVARDEGADLIVVGSDRRPGDYRAYKVLGLRLLHGAPCAVAIAPDDPESEIRRIGVAYDGSAESELALAAAYELAQRLHAAVTLYLAVMHDASWGTDGQLAHRDAGALLDAAAERAPSGVNPATVVLPGYASHALVKGTAGVVDLLVMGSRGQGPLQHAITGSTSRAVTVEIDCPVLITPRGAGVRAAVP
jgi:nucleotide-binding universal stress UspA family protein